MNKVGFARRAIRTRTQDGMRKVGFGSLCASSLFRKSFGMGSKSDMFHFDANVVVDTTSLDSTSSQIRFEKGPDFGTGRECGRSKRKRQRKRKTRRTRRKRRSSKGTRTRVWERKRKRKSEKERKRKGRVKGTGRIRGKGSGKRRGKGRGRERGRFEFRRHRTPASAGSPVPEASARRRAGHGAPAYKQGCPPITLVKWRRPPPRRGFRPGEMVLARGLLVRE